MRAEKEFSLPLISQIKKEDKKLVIEPVEATECCEMTKLMMGLKLKSNPEAGDKIAGSGQREMRH